MRRTLVACIALFAAGCLGDLVPTVPPVDAPDLGGSNNGNNNGGGGDMSGGGNPGGGDLAAASSGNVPHFDPAIQSDLDSLGCAAGGCHGGGLKPALTANPMTASAIAANYSAFSQDAMNGASSLVLTKPLTGSGVSHGGGKFFSSTSDPVYVRWLAWVNAGSPQ